MRRLRTRRDDESGAISVMAVALLAAMVLATSLAVDIGRIAYVSRDQQGVTDRAALDGVRALGDVGTGGPVATTVAGAVQAAMDRNPGAGALSDQRRVTRVTLGRFDGTSFRPGPSRGDDFANPVRHPDGVASKCDAGPPVGDTGPFDAVCVDTESWVPFAFALGDDLGGRWVTRSAVAAIEPIASFSAGSRTASLDGGVVNELVGAMVDGELGLDAVSYAGIAGVPVDLGLLAGQLDVGTVDELLDAEVGVLEVVHATLDVLAAGDDAAGLQLAALRTALPADVPLPPVRLGEVLDVDTTGPAGAATSVDALGLVLASLQLANDEHAVTLDTGVPGLATVDLTVIEPPVLASGPAGKEDGAWRTVATTAQVRLDVDVPTGDVVVGGVLDVLDGLLGGLVDFEVLDDDLQLQVTTGGAEVALSGVACGTPGAVELDPRTTAGTATIPPVDVLRLTALFGSAELARLGLELDTELAASDPAPFAVPGTFPTEVTVPGTTDTGLDGILADIEPTADVAGIPVDDVVDALVDALGDVLAPVEAGFLSPLLEVLGANLGGVDVTVHGVDCTVRRLVR